MSSFSLANFYNQDNIYLDQQDEQFKYSTYLFTDIFDDMHNFYNNLNDLDQFKNNYQQELDQKNASIQLLIIKNVKKNIIQSIYFNKKRRQIIFSYNYPKEKIIYFENNFFNHCINKLTEKTQGECKLSLSDSYLNFQQRIFLKKNCTKEIFKRFIKNKEVQINDLIFLIQKIMKNKQNIQVKLNLPTETILNLGMQNKVKLINQIQILDQNYRTKTIIFQLINENNLIRKVYRDQFETDQAQFFIIQDRVLQKLETQINTLISNFHCKIQKIISNLFIQFSFDFQLNRHFQFQELQKFSDYIDNFQQYYDTFEVRLQLLIQIMCSFLFQIEMKFINLMKVKEVVLIDSNKQIQLDMVEYLKCEQSNQQQKELELQSILNYFELLLPKREKQILINGYNLSTELENLKILIGKNKINLSDSILKLLKLQDLIQQENKTLKQSII